MDEGPRLQEVQRKLLEMMKDSERHQELWRVEVEEKQAQTLAELKTLIAGLSLQNQEVMASKSVPEGETSTNPNATRVGNQLSNNFIGPSSKVDFPHFDGTGLDGWLLRVEYFFEVDCTPPENGVRLAALRLDGKAI